MLKILSHHTWRGFGSDFLFLIDVSNNAHKVKKSHFNAASPTAVSSDVCRQCPIHTCADRQHCTETQTCAHPSRAARVRGWHRCPHSSGTHCHHWGGLGSKGEPSKEEEGARDSHWRCGDGEAGRTGCCWWQPRPGPTSGEQDARERATATTQHNTVERYQRKETNSSQSGMN